MAELTEARVVEMETQTAAYRREQQEQREITDAQAALIQRDRALPLIEFVESDEYKAFVKRAEELRDSMIGDALIHHLDGALINLGVVTMQVSGAKQRFEAAETRIAQAEAAPAEPAP